MLTVFIDRKDLQLELDGKRLLVRRPNAGPQGLPLTMLDRLVIHSQVTLDSRLLGTLGQHGIGVTIMHGRTGQRQIQLLCPGHNDARRRLAQYQLWHDATRRLKWSRQLVQAKIAALHKFLQSALVRRPDLRYPLSKAITGLTSLVPSMDKALSIDVVRGLEGSAAAMYFAGFQHLFADSLDFTGRNRRPPRDPVNACLSLVYTLIHNEAVRACHGAGLDPMLGFYHEPAYGRQSLACDVIEPLRPRVDRWVWRLFRKRLLSADHFSRDGQRCLLNKSGRRTFFEQYEAEAGPWRRYLRLHGYQMAHALLDVAPELPEADDP